MASNDLALSGDSLREILTGCFSVPSSALEDADDATLNELLRIYGEQEPGVPFSLPIPEISPRRARANAISEEIADFWEMKSAVPKMGLMNQIPNIYDVLDPEREIPGYTPLKKSKAPRRKKASPVASPPLSANSLPSPSPPIPIPAPVQVPRKRGRKRSRKPVRKPFTVKDFVKPEADQVIEKVEEEEHQCLLDLISFLEESPVEESPVEESPVEEPSLTSAAFEESVVEESPVEEPSLTSAPVEEKVEEAVEDDFPLPASFKESVVAIESLGFGFDRAHIVEVLISHAGAIEDTVIQLSEEREKLVLEKKKEARESLIASLESSKADDIFERMAELALSGKTEGNSLADFVAAFRSL